MLCVVFGLSLLDRTNISAAYIAGMSADLELTVGARYSIALLVFFIGYALFEIPSNLVIRRLGAQWWLSFLIVSWGLCVLGMGFVHNWEALTVCRALLGVFEAGRKHFSSLFCCYMSRCADIPSLPRRYLHYWFLVQTVRDRSSRLTFLYGLPALLRIWTHLCIRPVANQCRKWNLRSRMEMDLHH